MKALFQVGDIVDCIVPRTYLPKGRYLVLSVDDVQQRVHVSPIKIEEPHGYFKVIIGDFLWSRFVMVMVDDPKIKRNLPAWF